MTGQLPSPTNIGPRERHHLQYGGQHPREGNIAPHTWQHGPKKRNVDGFVEDASLIATVPIMEHDNHPPYYSVKGFIVLAQTT
jgi:hypothetical protein